MAARLVTGAEWDPLLFQFNHLTIQVQQNSATLRQFHIRFNTTENNMNRFEQRLTTVARQFTGIARQMAYINNQMTAAAGDVVFLQHDVADNHMRDFAHRVPFEMLQQDVRNLQDQMQELAARNQQASAPNHHRAAPYLQGHANGPNDPRVQGPTLQDLSSRVAALERLFRSIDARLCQLEQAFGRDVCTQAGLQGIVDLLGEPTIMLTAQS